MLQAAVWARKNQLHPAEVLNDNFFRAVTFPRSRQMESASQQLRNKINILSDFRISFSC